MKHLTSLRQMWPKYLPLATFTYKTSITPALANYSPYEFVFDRKPKLLLNLEITPDIELSGSFKDYCNLLNNRLQYLHKLLHDFKILAMINKDRIFFSVQQWRFSLYYLTPHNSVHPASRKVMIKYVGPVVIYM